MARAYDPKITEAAFQSQVVEYAMLKGWTLVYHTHDSRRSHKGFPDLVLVNPRMGTVVFAELKSMSGKLKPEQWTWKEGLEETISNWQRMFDCPAQVDYCLWRPSDWDDIMEVLG